MFGVAIVRYTVRHTSQASWSGDPPFHDHPCGWTGLPCRGRRGRANLYHPASSPNHRREVVRGEPADGVAGRAFEGGGVIPGPARQVPARATSDDLMAPLGCAAAVSGPVGPVEWCRRWRCARHSSATEVLFDVICRGVSGSARGRVVNGDEGPTDSAARGAHAHHRTATGMDGRPEGSNQLRKCSGACPGMTYQGGVMKREAATTSVSK